MSTVQRWQTPVCLSFVLIAAILFVLALGLRIDARAVAGGPATTPVDATTPATTPTTVQCIAPAATPAPPAPTVVPAPFGIAQNVSGSSNLAVAGTGNQTQGNDGGFGDVGMQFQNVNVLAPINIVHISNEGSGNTNTVTFGASGPVSTSTPATVDPATPAPATADPATTTPATTPDTLPAKVWTSPTAPATSSSPDATASSTSSSPDTTAPATS
ncbi:MAG TPA: hypothetical protein VHU85_07565 [Acidimicrobiales bacterium]|jgi:hypothetical protein|nr:hypothetical protein [Acidimicrobiales bacterium]